MLCNFCYKKFSRARWWLTALVAACCFDVNADTKADADANTRANGTAWQLALPEAKSIGSGELRWFGLRIYTAELWAEDETFSPARPFALQLTYHRSIKREQFVAKSVEEIRRLFGDRYSAATLQRWEAEMNRAFTDVQAGDQLIGVSLPNKGCQFYSRSQQLADIRDPEFAQAFFAIWFDPRSKDKRLRESLLGDAS